MQLDDKKDIYIKETKHYHSYKLKSQKKLTDLNVQKQSQSNPAMVHITSWVDGVILILMIILQITPNLPHQKQDNYNTFTHTQNFHIPKILYSNKKTYRSLTRSND